MCLFVYVCVCVCGGGEVLESVCVCVWGVDNDNHIHKMQMKDRSGEKERRVSYGPAWQRVMGRRSGREKKSMQSERVTQSDS